MSGWTRRGFLTAVAATAAGAAHGMAPVASGDRRLYTDRARILIERLQKRWYHPGSFLHWGPDQNEWNCHCTLETLADYTQMTGDRSYLDAIRLVARDKTLRSSAMNDGVDDMAWAAIAHLKVYELTREPLSLSTAQEIFTNMTAYWDDICNGGLWWDRKRTYKNAITNELFLVLATRLHAATHDPEPLRWAHREWDWFARSGMINADSLVNDGLDHCHSNRDTTWTYNQGVVLGGLTDLYRLTHDRGYLDQAVRIASATIDRLTANVDGIAILKEPGGVLNSDQQQFKGVFMLYLAPLVLALPDGSLERRRFTGFILENADAVWKLARNGSNEINAAWHGGDAPPLFSATTQTSGIALMNAAALVSR